MMKQPLAPGLYVVATPIGNLGDLSLRAADVLREAQLVLAEDTRITGKLLKHIDSKVPMRRYDDHATANDRAAIVQRLGQEVIALVSDAGTPLISDPGYKLVRDARAADHSVFTIPGPCAAIAGLTLSGLPTDRFLFAGFLPAKAKAKSDAIAELAGVAATLVFYESGPRLGDTLGALTLGLGKREAVVAREITKLHEESVAGSLAELGDRFSDSPPKGEIVIVVGPPPEAEPTTDEELDSALKDALRSSSASRAAAQVAEQLGVPRKRAYARALELVGK
jgi:16S rRNA (cytidine1402-2'-O)-methyltransferase